MLLGDDPAANEAQGGAAAGASQKDAPNLAQRQNGGPSIKINMSSSKAQDKKDASSNAKAMVSLINCYPFLFILCCMLSVLRVSTTSHGATVEGAGWYEQKASRAVQAVKCGFPAGRRYVAVAPLCQACAVSVSHRRRRCLFLQEQSTGAALMNGSAQPKPPLGRPPPPKGPPPAAGGPPRPPRGPPPRGPPPRSPSGEQHAKAEEAFQSSSPGCSVNAGDERILHSELMRSAQLPKQGSERPQA